MTFIAKLLDPSTYRRQPWKNGGGVSTTIAAQMRTGAEEGDWSNTIWQLGRTAIVAPGPFSDLSGFERLQVVVHGRGLVLEMPSGEIDVRTPFVPVRYDGGSPIVSRLESGPVEVVNLIARRSDCRSDLRVVVDDGRADLRSGEHILYAPRIASRIVLNGTEHSLPHDHALHLTGEASLICAGGTVLVATIIHR